MTTRRPEPRAEALPEVPALGLRAGGRVLPETPLVRNYLAWVVGILLRSCSCGLISTPGLSEGQETGACPLGETALTLPPSVLRPEFGWGGGRSV